MKSIRKNITNEIIIKNSRFITLLIKINNESITNIMSQIKKDYTKASHYCYAYIYKDIKRSSDDGEPGSTAGMPMLNVLEKENITNVLAVTVRYFGGIKLGAGGLVRAYSKSVKEALDKSEVIELKNGYKIELEVAYEKQKDLDYLLKEEEIIEKKYDLNVKYLIHVKKENIDILNNYKYKILEEEYY